MLLSTETSRSMRKKNKRKKKKDEEDEEEEKKLARSTPDTKKYQPAHDTLSDNEFEDDLNRFM